MWAGAPLVIFRLVNGYGSSLIKPFTFFNHEARTSYIGNSLHPKSSNVQVSGRSNVQCLQVNNDIHSFRTTWYKSLLGWRWWSSGNPVQCGHVYLLISQVTQLQLGTCCAKSISGDSACLCSWSKLLLSEGPNVHDPVQPFSPVTTNALIVSCPGMPSSVPPLPGSTGVSDGDNNVHVNQQLLSRPHCKAGQFIKRNFRHLSRTMYSPATRRHLFFMSLFIIFNFSWMFLIFSTAVFNVFFFFSKPNAYTSWHVHFLYGYQLTFSLGWTRVCALPGVVTSFHFCCNEFVNFLLWSMWKCVSEAFSIDCAMAAFYSHLFLCTFLTMQLLASGTTQTGITLRKTHVKAF